MDVHKTVTISNEMGLHVRPATALAETARSFKASVQIVKDGTPVDAKSSIELLTLAATKGTRLEVRASGEDAEAAVDRITRMIESGFGEVY